jgi:drug/metabolite transporter (DMT)-like permease
MGWIVKPIQLFRLGVLSLLWGSSYLFIKVAVAGVDPVTLVEGRLLIGAGVLLAIMRLQGRRLPRDSRTWLHILVMAFVGVIVPQVSIAWSEQHISSSLASILNATTPFFTLLFAAGIFHAEHFSRENVAGLVVGFGGMAVLTGSGLADLKSASTHGELAMLLSSAGYGFGYAYARRYLRGQAVVLAASEMLAAAALTVPILIAFGQPGATALTPIRLGAWLTLGVLSSGLAYILLFGLIEAIGATRSSFTTYLIPIVGVFWGWLLLGEGVGLRTLAGVLLILSGVSLATWPRSTEPAPIGPVLETEAIETVSTD